MNEKVGKADRPIRVIVWGPGGVGGGCLREVIKQPEFEVVGVLAYSEEKDGLDAGELVGMDPIGVKVTRDKEKIHGLDADCILHAPMTTSAEEMDGDVIRALESGKNVISATAYHYPPLKGKEYAEKLEAACKRGNASLHGTGIHPNFLAERLGLTLTGICNRVEHIKFREFNETGRFGESPILTSLGYGAHPDTFKPGQFAYDNTERYYKESLLLTGLGLFGREMETVEFTPDLKLAEEDLLQPSGRMIKKGHIAEFKHTFVGYLDGKPRLTLEENWYIGGREKCPYPGAKSDDYYVIEIDAEPCSIRMEMGYKASFVNDLDFFPDDPTPPPFYATAVTMVQAAPIVCASPPGIVYPKIWAHFASDLRSLAAEAVGN